ncbi:unnamed protein product, partial [Rhizophagus irregularis]
YNSTSIGSWII